jgi:hypothetical protein
MRGEACALTLVFILPCGVTHVPYPNPQSSIFSPFLQELFKKYKKTNLQSIWNKISVQAHMELEFDVLGVVGKL